MVFLSHSYRTYLMWAAIVGSILTLLWLVVFFHDAWKLASAGGWTRLDWGAAWAARSAISKRNGEGSRLL
jgi:hypothetical protein